MGYYSGRVCQSLAVTHLTENVIDVQFVMKPQQSRDYCWRYCSTPPLASTQQSSTKLVSSLQEQMMKKAYLVECWSSSEYETTIVIIHALVSQDQLTLFAIFYHTQHIILVKLSDRKN